MTKNPFVPEFGVPLKVEPMRVRRTYSGGTGIDRWHNEAGRFGLERPEEWLASVTPAINPGFAKEEGEGLSRVEWQGKELGPKGSSDTVSAGNAWRRALEKPGRRAWHPC